MHNRCTPNIQRLHQYRTHRHKKRSMVPSGGYRPLERACITFTNVVLQVPSFGSVIIGPQATFSLNHLLRHRRLNKLALPRRGAGEIVVRFPGRALAGRDFFCTSRHVSQTIRSVHLHDDRNAKCSPFTSLKLTHHLIDLLKSKTPRLRDEEVCPEDAAGAEAAPDEEDFGAEVAVGWVNHVGDNDAWGRCQRNGSFLVPCKVWSLPMMQFQNQLAAVEMATPLDRMGNWKISPMMTQPAGPQVLARR